MIANCSVLIAQNSSVVFTGLALGKEVHSYLDRSRLQKLLPIQNGGKSAERISEVCRQLIFNPLAKAQWNGVKRKLALDWEA